MKVLNLTIFLSILGDDMKGHSKPKSPHAAEFIRSIRRGNPEIRYISKYLIDIIRDPEGNARLRDYLKHNKPKVIEDIKSDMNTVTQEEKKNMAFILAMTGSPKALSVLEKLPIAKSDLLDAYHILAVHSPPTHKARVVDKIMNIYWNEDITVIDKKLIINTLGRLRRDLSDTVANHLIQIATNENNAELKEMANKYLNMINENIAS